MVIPVVSRIEYSWANIKVVVDLTDNISRLQWLSSKHWC